MVRSVPELVLANQPMDGVLSDEMRMRSAIDEETILGVVMNTRAAILNRAEPKLSREVRTSK